MEKIKLYTLSFFAFVMTSNIYAQNLITFQIDLTEEESVKEVGIRGNIEPLSWDNSLALTDSDGDGIYTLSIEIPAVIGDTLEYKFLKDEIFEIQDKGNRIVILTGKAQILPISKWNLYSNDFLYERVKSLNFAKYIFIYSSGKKRGISPKEIAQEVIEFYNWRPNNWPTKPQDLLGPQQLAQSGQKGGYFELLEDQPGKVKFIMGRYWRNWFDLYGSSIGLDEDGFIQGVSKEDLETQYRSWLEHFCQKNDKNWKLDIEEQGESMWIITISVE